jgi:glucose-1-phosphate thymidylyltransferase
VKGVLLAGGTGSRLRPLTDVTNKHLLPVGREPMIFHPIRKMVDAGVREIMIVTGAEHAGAMIALLGSGRQFGADFTYRVQDEAGGIAQALGLARRFVGDDRTMVLLGDNIFEDALLPYACAFALQQRGGKILLKSVADPSRFGVAVIRRNRITHIVEKPKRPSSSLAVTGCYFYDASVFDIIGGLNRSARGELEITDVNNEYVRRHELTYDLLSGWWTDAGTFESLKQANELLSR